MKNIPKKLHLYWNRAKMSRLQTFTVETFHKLNPDWDINVYMPKQKYIPDYIGEDYFHLIRKMEYVDIKIIDLDDYGIKHDLHDILRSDILRYHILYNVGGVWSDFDVLWIKPMTYINDVDYIGSISMENVDNIVSFRHETNGYHSIGIMVHCLHSNYILSLIEQTKLIRVPYGHQSFGSTMINKMYPKFETLNKFENIIGIKYETYYPYALKNMNALYNKNDLNYINKNVMCVHWFNGHKLSKQYVNNDGFNRDCSMTTILKNEGCI